jgi:hypothetical protein
MSSTQIQQILALLGLYTKSGKGKKALRLLENKKEVFEQAGLTTLWRFWRGQSLIANGQVQKALEEAEREEDPDIRFRIKTLAFREMSRQSGDWRPLIEHLERHLEGENEAEVLLELCEIKAQQKDWAFVADQAERLCELIGTADAVRFAVSAAWNAGRPAQCAAILNRHQSLFPDGILPSELARLLIQCLMQTGSLLEAQELAEELLRRDSSVENIITLMDVQLTKVDSVGAALTARLLSRRDDVPPLQLLRASRLIMLDDPDLAKEFWNRAKDAASTDPSLAAEAMHLAFALGLEREATPLLARVQEFASRGEGPMQMLDIDQMFDIMRERQEHLNLVQNLYRQGETPLPLVAERFNRPLADIFHGQAKLNQTVVNLRNVPPILIRHGSRALPPLRAEHTERWKPHLDITALLLAAELNILDKIERCYGPLYVSNSMSQALRRQVLELVPPQQSEIDADKTIIQLADALKLHSIDETSCEIFLAALSKSVVEESSDAPEEQTPGAPVERAQRVEASLDSLTPEIEHGGQILESDVAPSDGVEQGGFAELEEQLDSKRLAILAAAHTEDGFAVGLLPLMSYEREREIVNLPEALSHRLINCRAVLDSLSAEEWVSDKTAEQAIRALGVEGNPNLSAAVPPVGSKLFLMDGVAGVLAKAGLLEVACEHFYVAMAETCIRDARNEIDELSRRGETRDWLRTLLNRFRLGIENQTYKVIYISDERLRETARPDFDEDKSPGFTTVVDLMRYEPEEGDVLWVDDRAINRFLHRDGVPVVGISELLLGLYKRDEIDRHEYYRMLLHLREGNFRYIPVDKEEILYHLSQAKLVDGKLVETEGMSALRRYLAACYLDEEILQPRQADESGQNSMGELPFVLNAMIAVMDAIAHVWADESIDKEIATARADWLLNNLYTGTLGNRHLLDRLRYERAGNDSFMAGIDIALLLGKGINISSKLSVNASQSKRRRDYYSWIEDRISSRRFKADPDTVKTVAHALQGFFNREPALQDESDVMETASRIVLQGLFLDLPEEVRANMRLEPQTMERLGLQLLDSASVGSLDFPVSDFWGALELVLRGEPATIKARETGIEYQLVAIHPEKGNEQTWPIVNVIDGEGKIVGTIGDTLLGLLSQNEDERRRTLERHRQMFDLAQSAFGNEIDRIIKLEDVRERMDSARTWLQESAENYYKELERRILHKRSFLWSELVPASAAGLLRHYRLSAALEGKTFKDLWQEAITSLLADEDLLAVLERAACLPVAMPQSIFDRLSELPPGDAISTIKNCASRWISPLPRLHLANLAMRLIPRDDEALQLSRDILSSLYEEEGAQHFSAFSALLDFVKDEFEFITEVEAWPSPIKLAMIWAHACRLHHMFHRTGATASDITSMFEGRSRQLGGEVLQKNNAFWNDCAHPRRLSRVKLLTHAAAALFAGVDKDTLEESGGIELILKHTLEAHESGIKFPNIQLISDVTRALNGLDSIFGGDRAAVLGQVLSAEELQVVSSDNLKELTQQALGELLVDSSQSGPWAQLLAILDDLPMYPDLQEQCASILRSLDPVSIFKNNRTAARFALRFAATQVLYLGDEDLRTRYQNHVLELVKLEVAKANQKESDQPPPRSEDDEDTALPLKNEIANLMDAALVLSIVQGNPGESSSRFSSILQRFLDTWPGFGNYFGYALSRLVFELPVNQLEGWWTLLLRLRAARTQPL